MSKGSNISLVTGGCGFIGTHIVRLLKGRGDSVRVFDLSKPTAPVDGVDYEQRDIRDRAALDNAIKGSHSVFHLAAMAGLWARNNSDFVDINQNGSKNVFESCAAHGVRRVVHCSTESILQGVRIEGRDGEVDEKVQRTLADMPGPYCKSKYLAEQEALKAAADGLPVVIVNPTVPIGPGDHSLTPPARMQLGYLNGKHPAALDPL